MNSDLILSTFGKYYKLHTEGYIHIHKLPRSVLIPYCIGLSLKPLVKHGLKTTTIRMNPPKHLRSFLGQVMKLGYLIQAEFTGAIAHSFVDLYSAPFIRYDKLSFKEIKNAIETYIYTIETPIRLSSDGLFVNWTLVGDWCTINHEIYHAGKKISESSTEFLDEIREFNKALIEVFLKGDADSRPFAFPILTIYVNDNFFKSELAYEFVKLAAERGSLYFLNSKYCPPTSSHAMCCRLILNHNVVEKVCSRGIWAIPDNTGSIGVVGINLPRLAFECKEESKVFDKLYELLQHGREILRIMRDRYYKSLYEYGLMPHTYLNYVLNDNGEVNKNFFSSMFSTFAVFGIAEYVSIITNNPHFWNQESKHNIHDAISIETKVLEFINKVTKEFQSEDNIMYNVEQDPAESATYRAALLDYEKFPEFREFIPKSIEYESGEEVVVPFYTSQNTPPYAKWSLDSIIEVEARVQKLYTGGVIKHFFFGFEVSTENLMKFIRLLYDKGLVYWSITPTITVCLECKNSFTGIYDYCPNCSSDKLEVWSRIIGYYAPLLTWNPGRKAEFKQRVFLQL